MQNSAVLNTSTITQTITVEELPDSFFLSDLIREVPRLRDNQVQKDLLDVIRNAQVESALDLLKINESHFPLNPTHGFRLEEARDIIKVWNAKLSVGATTIDGQPSPMDARSQIGSSSSSRFRTPLQDTRNVDENAAIGERHRTNEHETLTQTGKDHSQFAADYSQVGGDHSEFYEANSGSRESNQTAALDRGNRTIQQTGGDYSQFGADCSQVGGDHSVFRGSNRHPRGFQSRRGNASGGRLIQRGGAHSQFGTHGSQVGGRGARFYNY